MNTPAANCDRSVEFIAVPPKYHHDGATAALYGRTMSDWATVVAGLGGTVLGAGGTFLIDRVTARDRWRERRSVAVNTAITDVLAFADGLIAAHPAGFATPSVSMRANASIAALREFDPPANLMTALLHGSTALAEAGAPKAYAEAAARIIGALSVWISSSRSESVKRWKKRTAL